MLGDLIINGRGAHLPVTRYSSKPSILHIIDRDFETTDISVLIYTLLLHRFWQGGIAVLKRPAHKQLRWRARVAFCQRSECWVGHAERSNERSVRLDDDVILLAEVPDLGSRVEWTDFDLVDCGHYPRFVLNQFLEFCGTSTPMNACRISDDPYVLHTEVAHPATLDFTFSSGILDSPP